MSKIGTTIFCDLCPAEAEQDPDAGDDDVPAGWQIVHFVQRDEGWDLCTACHQRVYRIFRNDAIATERGRRVAEEMTS